MLGIAQAALALAIDWAKQRHTFGVDAGRQAGDPVDDRRLETSSSAPRASSSSRPRRGPISGLDIKVDASVAKVYATEIAGKVVDRCIQIFGGLGVAKELPLERWYRELRIKRIGEGPSEVHRMVIARDLLGGQRKVTA